MEMNWNNFLEFFFKATSVLILKKFIGLPYFLEVNSQGIPLTVCAQVTFQLQNI